VAYYENPGILMIVQTIEDGKGNHQLRQFTVRLNDEDGNRPPTPTIEQNV
jgi:hypothetical protein